MSLGEFGITIVMVHILNGKHLAKVLFKRLISLVSSLQSVSDQDHIVVDEKFSCWHELMIWIAKLRAWKRHFRQWAAERSGGILK